MLHSFPTTADLSQVYPLVSTKLPLLLLSVCNCSYPSATNIQWVFNYCCFSRWRLPLHVSIWFYRQKEDIDNCRLGYDIRSEYRCAPTNFVRRKVNLVCPEIQRVFIRSFDVPTACSCKLCYECDNVIPDPRAYLGIIPAKK